ncbi:DUF4236 domain-containing protein, partial [Leptospira bandrabouensis]
MGISFRKSIKAGPLRLNFSKSGLGVSTGIKGLRVGVNAKGRSYVGGGVAGFQYRQNLSSSKGRKKAGDDFSSAQEMLAALPKSQATIIESILGGGGLLGILVFPFIWGWFGFFLAIGFIITAFVISSSRNAALEFLEKNLEGTIDETKLNAIRERIKKLKTFSRYPDELLTTFLITHVKNSFEDRNLSKEEKELLLEFKNNLSPEAFGNSIMSGFAAILLEAVEDEDFDEAERNFLNEFIDLVQLKNDMKGMLEELITFFSQIEDLRKAETLESITPSLSVGEANETIYYESKATFQKSKNVSEDGTILVSDKNLHIYTGGHSKVKISDIIEMSCDQ